MKKFLMIVGIFIKIWILKNFFQNFPDLRNKKFSSATEILVEISSALCYNKSMNA